MPFIITWPRDYVGHTLPLAIEAGTGIHTYIFIYMDISQYMVHRSGCTVNIPVDILNLQAFVGL